MKTILKLVIAKGKEVLSKEFRQNNPKISYIIIAITAFIIFTVSLYLFLEITEDLKAKYMAHIDASLSQYIISFRTPALTDYFIFATNIGDNLGYLCAFIICSILFYSFFRSWKYFIELAIVSLLSLTSNVVLKQVIHRARPLSEHLVTVKTLSYPSGHAMSAMAFYGFLIYLVYTFKLKAIIKVAIIFLLAIILLSIGISRIYLGVHFPSDVAGGYIAGFLWVVLCVLILNIIKIFREDSST